MLKNNSKGIIKNISQRKSKTKQILWKKKSDPQNQNIGEASFHTPWYWSLSNWWGDRLKADSVLFHLVKLVLSQEAPTALQPSPPLHTAPLSDHHRLAAWRWESSENPLICPPWRGLSWSGYLTPKYYQGSLTMAQRRDSPTVAGSVFQQPRKRLDHHGYFASILNFKIHYISFNKLMKMLNTTTGNAHQNHTEITIRMTTIKNTESDRCSQGHRTIVHC